MEIDRLENAVVVPASAVIESDSGTTVYVVDKDKKVAILPVVAGQSFDGLRVITKELEPGVQVIVDGLQMIRPNQKVDPVTVELPRRIANGSAIKTAEALAGPKS
jgi:membrane fusion protein (multidrug efflux system)